MTSARTAPVSPSRSPASRPRRARRERAANTLRRVRGRDPVVPRAARPAPPPRAHPREACRATRLLRRLIDEQPRHPEIGSARMILARVLEQRERFTDAARTYEEVLKRARINSWTHAGTGRSQHCSSDAQVSSKEGSGYGGMPESLAPLRSSSRTGSERSHADHIVVPTSRRRGARVRVAIIVLSSGAPIPHLDHRDRRLSSRLGAARYDTGVSTGLRAAGDPARRGSGRSACRSSRRSPPRGSPDPDRTGRPRPRAPRRSPGSGTSDPGETACRPSPGT